MLSNHDQYIYYIHVYFDYMKELTFTYNIDIYNKLDTRLRYKKFYMIIRTNIYKTTNTIHFNRSQTPYCIHVTCNCSIN